MGGALFFMLGALRLLDAVEADWLTVDLERCIALLGDDLLLRSAGGVSWGGVEEAHVFRCGYR